MQMRSLFLFLLLIPTTLWAETGFGPDKSDQSIVSLESGVICAPPSTGEAAAPNTVAGTTHIIDKAPPFVSTQNRVPAVLGLGFGVKSQSETLGGESGVTMTIRHPPMGPNGVTQQTYDTRISDITPSITFYQFDFDYELLPGHWQMEAVKAGRVLFRTSFTVVRPNAIPELASLCGFEELLS